MAKGNRNIRNRTVGGMNWWEYLNSIRPKGFRNIPQLLDHNEILNRKDRIIEAMTNIKKRKRHEQMLQNKAKFATIQHGHFPNKPKSDKITKQIDNGFKIAHKWQYVDMSAFKDIIPINSEE